MDEIKDGGPAFPIGNPLPMTITKKGHVRNEHTPGMSIRDIFATAIAIGYVFRHGGIDRTEAKAIWVSADILLFMRDK